MPIIKNIFSKDSYSKDGNGVNTLYVLRSDFEIFKKAYNIQKTQLDELLNRICLDSKNEIASFENSVARVADSQQKNTYELKILKRKIALLEEQFRTLFNHFTEQKEKLSKLNSDLAAIYEMERARVSSEKIAKDPVMSRFGIISTMLTLIAIVIAIALAYIRR